MNWSLYFLHYKTQHIKQTIKISFQICFEAVAPQTNVCLLLKMHILCMLRKWLSSILHATVANRGGFILTHSRYFWMAPKPVSKPSLWRMLCLNMSFIYQIAVSERLCQKGLQISIVPQLWKFMEAERKNRPQLRGWILQAQKEKLLPDNSQKTQLKSSVKHLISTYTDSSSSLQPKIQTRFQLTTVSV